MRVSRDGQPPTRPQFVWDSGMHRWDDPDGVHPQWEWRPWDGSQAYPDSKLYDVLLAFAVPRPWCAVEANALELGWVATKMGGAGAPDDLTLAPVTQAWLAASDDASRRSGYYFHQQPREVHAAAHDVAVHDRPRAVCKDVSGLPLGHLPRSTVGHAPAPCATSTASSALSARAIESPLRTRWAST
jgi:hypothetical protein